MTAPSPSVSTVSDAAAHAPAGTVFYIVGASGVGKDSLIDLLRARLPARRFVFARRVITRPSESGGEDHEACTDSQFLEREARGEFLLSWQAIAQRMRLPAEQELASRFALEELTVGAGFVVFATALRGPR
ncbi:MAG: hypothetical protein RL458_775, partial [Pseudomonadota bacterium]